MNDQVVSALKSVNSTNDQELQTLKNINSTLEHLKSIENLLERVAAATEANRQSAERLEQLMQNAWTTYMDSRTTINKQQKW